MSDAKTIVQTAEIPSIPHVLQQILSLADSPSASSADLEKYVTQEPALVAQLLKWVNSAAYSLPQRVSSVAHAMILLGFSTVKSIASGMVLVNAFDDISGLSKDYVHHVWRHTLGAAAVMKIIARKEPNDKQDVYFLAAMIHDVGYLVLRQYYQEEYDKLLEEDPFPKPEREQEAFGIDHVAIGEELLKDWKFDEQVIQMVKYQHDSNHEECNQRDHFFLKICDEICDYPDLEEFLNLDEEYVEIELLTDLKKIGWSWKMLQEHRDEIVESIAAIDKLFSS